MKTQRFAVPLAVAALTCASGCASLSSREGNPQTITVEAAEAKGYQRLDFDLLAGFKFSARADAENATVSGTTKKTFLDQVPDAVKKLDGKKVLLTGFMMPTEMDRNGIMTEFWLERGETAVVNGVATVVPKKETNMNERVSVTVPEEKGFVEPKHFHLPIFCTGTLHVSEQLENGLLVGIYQIDGEAIIEPMVKTDRGVARTRGLTPGTAPVGRGSEIESAMIPETERQRHDRAIAQARALAPGLLMNRSVEIAKLAR